MIRAKAGRKSVSGCLGESLDEDGFALLPHFEPHAVALAKHLGGAADVFERDAKVAPRLAELELVEAILLRLLLLRLSFCSMAGHVPF